MAHRTQPGPKALAKAAKSLYGLNLNEVGAASVKFAGLTFLNKLAQVVKSKHQGSGRRTLAPVLASAICERFKRR